MNPSMENMILPSEDLDSSLEKFDSSLSQDGVDEPEDSMPNTSEVVPQEEPEVPLEEEAKADIDSDINSDIIECINNIPKEDLLSEPYEPSFLAMDH